MCYRKFEMFNDGEIDALEGEKTLELVDFVFENRLDKINFLKQYSKDISILSKVY